jgi:hypothetical protein
MKFKKIVGFGDSWMYGDELVDPTINKHYSHPDNDQYRNANCFLGRLGAHYQVPVENYGISGGSLHSTIWKFIQWFNQEPNPDQTLILVALTESDRFSYINPTAQIEKHRMVHSTWIEADDIAVPPEFKNLIKQQTVLTVCDQMSALTYQQAVLFFDGIASRNNLKLLQFHVSTPPICLTNIPTLIDPDFSLTHWFVHEIQPIHDRKYIHADGHPNELGSELVKDRLITYIDSCTMYEC